tara:strand:- start:393 stop:1265 length:873 start_codon:yes stop_codon:yes gene_type:complete
MTTVVDFDKETQTLVKIEKYIKATPENSRVFTITPSIAHHLLEYYNLHNRRKSEDDVLKYTRAMCDHRWYLTGDTLKFSDAGFLRDGQHRLMACIRAGEDFKTHIVFGIPDHVFPALDDGRSRPKQTAFTLAGVKNAAKVAAIVRWHQKFVTGTVTKRKTISNDEAMILYRSMDADLLETAVAYARGTYNHHAFPVGQVGALYYAVAAHPMAESYFQALSTGLVGGKYKPIGLLASEITRIKKAAYGRVHDIVRLAMLINSWNTFAVGKTGSRPSIEWGVEQPFPKVEGV